MVPGTLCWLKTPGWSDAREDAWKKAWRWPLVALTCLWLPLSIPGAVVKIFGWQTSTQVVTFVEGIGNELHLCRPSCLPVLPTTFPARSARDLDLDLGVTSILRIIVGGTGVSTAISQAILASILTRPLVTITLKFAHFSIATYLSQAITVRWYTDEQLPIYNIVSFTKAIPQKTLTFKTLARTNTSEVMVNGIETAPSRTSAKAMLVNRMFEVFFCSVLLFFNAKITKMFRRMVTGQMMVVAIAVILNTVVSLKTHICIGGQNNSDSNWLEALATRSVLWGIILVQYLLEHDKNGSDVNDHWNRTENWVLTQESDLSVNVFSLRVRVLLLSLIRTLRLIPAQRRRSYKSSI